MHLNERLRRYWSKRPRRRVPLVGFTEGRCKIRFVEMLTDKELAWLNELLDWKCFVVDSEGRRFGNIAWEGKRCEPQVIPDRRIILMNERFNLVDKHVLEVGCFEGIHTVGLCMFAPKVTAIDARVENVVKSIVRCAMFGYSPTVVAYNIEQRPPKFELLRADVVHHVGVLYHLQDPVTHLLELGQNIRVGVMLDTHFCLDEEARDSYLVNGRAYLYKLYRECGLADVFSGVYDHSKWLRLRDIVGLLETSGFVKVEVVEVREERNGPRALLFAEKATV
jgi:tRNA (mo5U34)-methyltransferase